MRKSFEILQDQTTLTYLYSENDLRIYKKSLLSSEAGNQWSEDYYLMDAFGKTVAILHKSQSDITGKWEYFASGAERECRLVPDENQTNITFGKAEASFYLYDHLGNTRVTYTPTGFITHPNDPTDCVNEVNSVVDYFPYGKVLRHKDVLDERYLTTQHERDQETDLDYRGARYYDGDVGRFLSLDPHARNYPSLNDYCYVADNPLMFLDSDGKDFRIYYNDADGNQASVQINSVDDESLKNVITESGNNLFVAQFVEAVQYVDGADRKNVFKKLAKRRKIIAVHLETGRDTQFSTSDTEPKDGCQVMRDDESGIIAWNPYDGNEFLDNGRSPTGEISSPAINLLHEGGHGLIQLYKPILFHVYIRFIGADEEQITVRKYEKKAEQDLDEPVRRNREDYENTRGIDVPNVTYHKKIQNKKE